MIQQIKKQFDEVISWSQNISQPQTNELFRNWENAKAPFIEAFGGLIYEYPEKVKFYCDKAQKQTKIKDFVEEISCIYNNYELAHFIEENNDTFFENRVSKPYFKDDIKIHAHSKLVKSFKFFEKDKKVLYTLQNKASQIIQEDCVEGTLCFSVHPLDYLSISENIYNWRSCHSLSGEYRAGNLSYMQDECTVICYLKGEDNVKLPMFPDSVPWNSKKWRVLFYVHNSKELIFAGRQYPFESKSGMQQVLDIWVSKIMRKYNTALPGFFNWKDTTITDYIEKDNKVFLHDLHLPVRNKLYALPDLVQDACLSLHYNDVLYSPHCSHPNYWVNNDYYHENQFEPIIVGSAVKCLDCGKEIIADSETMRCDKCELEHGTEVNNTYTFCSCCGIRIVRDDGIEIGANDIICDVCCDNECFVCHCCDELCYNTEKHYHNGRFYCDDCYKEIMEEE